MPEPLYVACGAATLTPLDEPAGLDAPANAVAALVTPVSGDVAYTEDGSTPTADPPALSGSTMFSGNMRVGKFIQVDGDASIAVEFYKLNPQCWPLPTAPKTRPEL